ncbi:hypothetical protein P7K49_009482 [Saguinus oedipus]|uniref:Uncharacterized protein n=1 Tax=Saguinus oedipus TaxID=9490 RepID=A0ABQ9VK31_SAGOE|nr:hypothetical protein P7K49_009482 [Saguinus oedipus]
MEASTGDDKDPGDLRAHCPAAPAAAQSAECQGVGWGPRAVRWRGRSTRQAACPPSLLAAAAQLSAAVGSAARVFPACAHPPLSLIRAWRLQQRLQRRCAKPGPSGASRRGCGGRVDSAGSWPCAAPRQVGAACNRLLR